MKSCTHFFLALFIIFSSFLNLLSAQNELSQTERGTFNSAGFIEEKGQFKTFDNLRYHWYGNNVFVYFLTDRVVFITREINYENNESSLEAAAKGDDALAKQLSAVTVANRFDLIFVNNNQNSLVKGEDENSVKHDYYLAHCPDGILNAPSYNKLRYKNIYPNIDIVFSIEGKMLKYEFEVKAGGNPSDINLRWDGVKELLLNKNNEVQFNISSYNFTDKAPVSFCGDKKIATKYIVDGNNIRFNVADYDHNTTLVIDPCLFWASSLQYNGYGSWGALVTNTIGDFYYVDWEWDPGSADVASYLSSAGSSMVYTGGTTDNDIIISKFSKNGALLWACRYGGTNDDDISGAVTLDDNNNLFIAGKTFSSDLPLQVWVGAYNQAYNGTCSGTRGYILKFLQNNTRQWATYIDNGANFEPFDIACGMNNDIYIAGKSGSTLTCTGITIPSGSGYLGAYTSNSAAHNFVLRFNSSGALTWSTWLPGTTNSTGRVSDIAVSKINGDVFLAGDEIWGATYNFSAALISSALVYQGQSDLFYLKFNSSNNAVPAYGKYLGGAGFDKINIGAANGDIELDASGNLYMCGHTYSANFPLVNSGGCSYYDGIINDGSGIVGNVAPTQDGYLFKVNSAGTIIHSTFFGGTGYTSMKQLKKDSHNNLWICSEQTTVGLPTVSHADYFNQAITGTSNNIMFSQLGTYDNMEWLSYYGFSGYAGYAGFDIWEPTVDSVYLDLAGNFNVISNIGGGYQYVGATSCSGAAEFKHRLSSAPFTISGATTLCAGATTTWTATMGGGTWTSSNPGVATINPTTGLVTGVSGGTTTITYSLTISTCVFTATGTVTVTAVASIASVTGTTPLCIGGTATYSANSVVLGGGTGTWSSSNSGIASVNGSGLVTGVSAGTCNIIYTITGGCGGTVSAQQTVTINPNASIASVTGTTPLCIGGTATYSANSVVLGGGTGTWSSSNSGIASVNGSGLVTGVSAGTCNIIYTITGGCGGTVSAQQTVTINPNASIASVTGTTPLCIGGTATYSANSVVLGGGTGTWSSSNSGIASVNGSGLVTGVSAGTCNIIYTITGGCGGTVSAQQTVTINPNASIASVTGTTPLCIGGTATYSANSVVLGGGTGTWSSSNSGIASVNGSGLVTGVSAGTCNIIYTITGGCGGTVSAQQTVTINPNASIASVTGTTPLCIGGTATYSANSVVLGGGTGTWSSSNSGIASVNGSGLVTGVSAGTCNIVFTITGGCGGTVSAQQSVTVNSNSTAATSINATANPICTGDATTLSVVGGSLGTGAVWNWFTGGCGTTLVGTGISISVSPSANTTYYVLAQGTCNTSTCVSLLVTVNVVNAEAGNNQTICLGDNATLTATGGGTYLWSELAQTSPSISVSPSTTTTYSVTVYNGGCSATDQVIVNVTTGADASITSTGPYCSAASPVNLAAVDPGGTWTGTGITNGSLGTFDPSVSGAGTFQIIYTITGSCGDADTVMISVISNANATINPAGPYCSADNPVNMTAATSGGVWSGSGITNSSLGTFDPTAAGTGTHQIIYTIAGQCGDADTILLTVNHSANATITQPASFCVTASAANLISAETGGIWTGTGITNASLGTFDPVIAGVGIHQIIYTISGVCGDADTVLITVVSTYDATINPAGPYCSNSSPVILTAIDAGGTWSGSGITNTATGQFSPALVGVGSFQVIYTISGACGDADTAIIVVNPAANATINAAGPYCFSDNPVTLTSVQPGGVWSGTGITNTSTGAFDPGTAGVGSHVITYIISGACADTGTITVMVNSLANAAITPAGPYCLNNIPVNLTAATAGGVWTGGGITNASSGLFNPAVAGVGLHIIIYTISGNCGNVDTISITVYDIPEGTATATGETCTGANDGTGSVSVSGGLAPYTYNWSNTETTQTVNNLPPDIYTVTITDAHSCSIIDTAEVIASSIPCDTYTPHVYVPNIFSPNNDGQNDVLYVYGKGIKTLLLVIYDRWGEKVFETTDVNTGWDGRYKGKDMDAAVFVYYLKATLDNDEIVDVKGNITLVR